jgi:hypothetical protein
MHHRVAIDTVEVIGSIPVAPMIFSFLFSGLQSHISFQARLFFAYFQIKSGKPAQSALLERVDAT